jgi:hypothetical protein
MAEKAGGGLSTMPQGAFRFSFERYFPFLFVSQDYTYKDKAP